MLPNPDNSSAYDRKLAALFKPVVYYAILYWFFLGGNSVGLVRKLCAATMEAGEAAMHQIADRLKNLEQAPTCAERFAENCIDFSVLRPPKANALFRNLRKSI